MSMPSDDLDLGQTLRGFVAGQRLFGRYTLERVLGRGGMGIVWLARDEELERAVALKFLPELLVHDKAVVDELRRETKRSLELTHRNIVRIYDFSYDGSSACISMEYVDGETLSARRVENANKVFEVEQLKPVVAELCDALDYAHNWAKVVHRDLKPANLMLNSAGVLKVTDFGIARSLADSVSAVTMGRSTSGTLVYMSPQQLDGQRPSHLDDIYSVGASIFELLTSKPPFYIGDVARQVREKIPGRMAQRRKELCIEGATIPEPWERSIAACLSKDPRARPQSAKELAARLDGASRRTVGTRAPEQTSGSPSKPVAITLGFGLIAIAIAAVLALWIRPGFVKQFLAPAHETAPAVVASNPAVSPPRTEADRLENAPTAGARSPQHAEGQTSAEISSDPTGATILRGGYAIGTTPFRRDDFPLGKATLVFTSDGCLPREVEVDAKSEGLKLHVVLARPAARYIGEIQLKDEPHSSERPLEITIQPSAGTGTMTQSTKYGDFVVKYKGVWRGTNLEAVTTDTISQPKGVQWTPESFALRFSDDAASGLYESMVGGKTYVANLSPASPIQEKVQSVYSGKIAPGDMPLTITFAIDRRSGTITETTKSGDTVVVFSGIWDGDAFHAVTGEVVRKPDKAKWRPESFTLNVIDNGRRLSYSCNDEGKLLTAQLSAL